MADPPGLDCLVGLHLHVDVLDDSAGVVGGWCMWCGTAAYDPDRITDDGDPVGFTPTYAVRIAPGFHRGLDDAGL